MSLKNKAQAIFYLINFAQGVIFEGHKLENCNRLLRLPF